MSHPSDLTTVAGLKRHLTPGVRIRIENHIRPEASRIATVLPKTNTVDLVTTAEGAPAGSHLPWPKAKQLRGDPDPATVHVYELDGEGRHGYPFLTITVLAEEPEPEVGGMPATVTRPVPVEFYDHGWEPLPACPDGFDPTPQVAVEAGSGGLLVSLHHRGSDRWVDFRESADRDVVSDVDLWLPDLDADVANQLNDYGVRLWMRADADLHKVKVAALDTFRDVVLKRALSGSPAVPSRG